MVDFWEYFFPFFRERDLDDKLISFYCLSLLASKFYFSPLIDKASF